MSQVSVTWHSTWHPINNERLGFSWPLHHVFYSWETKPRQWWGEQNSKHFKYKWFLTSPYDLKNVTYCYHWLFGGFFAFELQLLTPHSSQKSHANDRWFLIPWTSPMSIWNLKKLRWFGFHPSHERSPFPQGLAHPTPWGVNVPMLSTLHRDGAPHHTGSFIGSTYYAKLYPIAHILPCNQFNFMLR